MTKEEEIAKLEAKLDFAKEALKTIRTVAKRLTSGNVSHQGRQILASATYGIDMIDEE